MGKASNPVEPAVGDASEDGIEDEVLDGGLLVVRLSKRDKLDVRRWSENMKASRTLRRGRQSKLSRFVRRMIRDYREREAKDAA